MAKFGKWIGGGLGWAVGGPIGALLGVFVGTLFDQSLDVKVTNQKGRRVYQSTPLST